MRGGRETLSGVVQEAMLDWARVERGRLAALYAKGGDRAVREAIKEVSYEPWQRRHLLEDQGQEILPQLESILLRE